MPHSGTNRTRALLRYVATTGEVKQMSKRLVPLELGHQGGKRVNSMLSVSHNNTIESIYSIYLAYVIIVLGSDVAKAEPSTVLLILCATFPFPFLFYFRNSVAKIR